MRVLSRVALVVLVVFSFSPSLLRADHLLAECELSLVGSNPATSDVNLSPHAIFRSGSLVFVLRGQTLTTYNVTDIGDLQVAREDVISNLDARDPNGGVAFSNGYMFVSSDAGLEIFDLHDVRAGGSAPLLVSTTPALHYQRLTVSGSMLAGLYPIESMGCAAGFYCYTTVDLFNISNLKTPQKVGTISTRASQYVAFNDIAFNQGFLYATGEGGTYGFNLSTPSLPTVVGFDQAPGKFLISNGTSLLAVGRDEQIDVYTVALNGGLTKFANYTLPYETFERANPLMFHPEGWVDDQNGRLITMVDERNPLTGRPARTIAFDVFDFTVPLWYGSYERPNESLTYVGPDEVKHHPFAVGPYVYVVGDMSGLQTYGACGRATGRIEWNGLGGLPCGGAEIHGWVTGTQKITSVELLLDNGSLGSVNVGGPLRTDVSSKTPVNSWRVNVNLDQTVKGEHILRAIATDAAGNRYQFASQRVYFGGPGQNCTTRFRAVR